jgi:hypothetical protein
MIWLLLAAVFALVTGSLNVPLLERLVAHGVKAQATVIELTPQMHGTVRYQYEVGGEKFEGQRGLWSPNPQVIHVGDSVTIYYDPLNPSRSVAGNPEPMLTNELISVGMATLLAPTFIMLVWRRKRTGTKKAK